MVFSSLFFLYFFLPIVMVCYWFSPKVLKNTILLGASLFFYAWGEPKYVVLMLVSILLNYLFGLAVEYSKKRGSKKAWVLIAIIANLGILGFYKYAGFFIENINLLMNWNVTIDEVPLPIGISFYTFQAMSYVIDVYRKDAKVQRSFINLSLYIALFPQLIAGPIVRYQTIADQINKRVVNSTYLVDGTRRFIQGLSKKVLIANPMGEVADSVFRISGGDLTTASAWIGILAYTLQIYFDFSGYSDMALGLGKLFGFDFEENFRYPYVSQSISEFWRRWHISLGNWFRDYVYFPLGGNRGETWKVYRNLIIVWTLTGFWHGASWTFMAWGFYYGFIISIEKFFLLSILKRLWRPLRHVYVLLIVMIGWVFFRADNFPYALEYIRTLFSFDIVHLYNEKTVLYLLNNWYVFIIAIILVMPVYPMLRSRIYSFLEGKRKELWVARDMISSVVYILFFLIVTMYLVNATYNPFIYFRF